MNTRNRSIDAIKGILIFLVVIGHVLPGSLDENVIRYVIYSFHMPAFFFVSGYLLDMKRLAGQNYPSVFSKYWRRMLLEWSVACLVYGCYVLRGGFDITGVIRYLYDPWYHLWFVPALFVMVSVLWLAYRIIRDDVVRYILLFAFGLLFYSLSHTEFAISRVFNCSLMFFVVLGMFSRERLSYIKIHSGGGNICLHFGHFMRESIHGFQNVVYQHLYGGSDSGHTLPVGNSSRIATWKVRRQGSRILGTELFADISLACDSSGRFEMDFCGG